MTFLRFCKKTTTKKQGGLILRTKQTVVLAFQFLSSDSDSRYYHIYCKFFIIKHKTWFGDVSNAWDGTIENKSDDEHDVDGNDPIYKVCYIQKFNEFSEKVDIEKFDMLNSDVHRLRCIQKECNYFYMEEQGVLCESNPGQPDWMQFADMCSDRSEERLNTCQM